MFSQLVQSRIAKRLLLTVLAAAVALICIISLAVGIATFYLEKSALEEQVRSVEQTFLGVIRTAMWVDDRESLQLALLGIARMPGIASADIHAKEELISSAGLPKGTDAFNHFIPISYTYNGKTYQLGDLHLTGDRDYIYGKIKGAVFTSVLIQSLVIPLVCVVIFLLIYHRVVVRLLNITAFTSSLTQDSLDRELQTRRVGLVKDELDDLADSINGMRENLRTAFEKMHRAERQLIRDQKELENLVSLRTSKLRKTNQRLHEEIEERTAIEEEREKLISELQTALAEIKKLGGLLPICAHCKKIRDDSGYWSQLESYISTHSEAEFSHSICPDCVREHYPDLAEEYEKQEMADQLGQDPSRRQV